MMQLLSSSISINDLLVHAPIGVAEQERIVGNDIAISLTIKFDVSKAMLSDNVDDTLNYADVAYLVREVALRPAKLLEHLAYSIASELFAHWPMIEALDMTVTKLSPPISVETKGAGLHLHLINRN